MRPKIAKYLTILGIVLLVGLPCLSQENLQGKSPYLPIDTFPIIHDLVAEVDTTLIIANIQHLQDYGTRFCSYPEAFEAQDWIASIFESYGLEVELQDFPINPAFGTDASNNVIAKLVGEENPDEYVVLGGHYDSYTSGWLIAPGADDNASGTCGVMEVARILSQYKFKRTIIFCAFSAEEIGLVGSDAYATRCKQQGMDIIGYINMDMIGYLHPGDSIHTDIYYKNANALELVDFYKSVTPIYVSEFSIEEPEVQMPSDHLSFHKRGYLSIFPGEDYNNYSPYIHTILDTIGTSVNSLLMAMKFTQAALASVVSLAIPYDPVGVEDRLSNTPSFMLFPNPVNNQITIKTNSPEQVHARIYSLSGQLHKEINFNQEVVVDISHLSAGMYILKMSTSNGVQYKKLIKK